MAPVEVAKTSTAYARRSTFVISSDGDSGTGSFTTEKIILSAPNKTYAMTIQKRMSAKQSNLAGFPYSVLFKIFTTPFF